jgi:hypothetical protein
MTQTTNQEEAMNERREFNRELVNFLGPVLGMQYITNLRLQRAKKEAQIFRMVQERNR